MREAPGCTDNSKLDDTADNEYLGSSSAILGVSRQNLGMEGMYQTRAREWNTMCNLSIYEFKGLVMNPTS